MLAKILFDIICNLTLLIGVLILIIITWLVLTSLLNLIGITFKKIFKKGEKNENN